MENDLINELYKTLEAKDNIINNQALEIARLNNEIQLRIKSIEKLENDIIEYQRDRARLKTYIKTIKRNCKRDKAKLRKKINKAKEYIELTMTDELLEDGSGFIRRYFKDDYRAKELLEILGDKE